MQLSNIHKTGIDRLDVGEIGRLSESPPAMPVLCTSEGCHHQLYCAFQSTSLSLRISWTNVQRSNTLHALAQASWQS